MIGWLTSSLLCVQVCGARLIEIEAWARRLVSCKFRRQQQARASAVSIHRTATFDRSHRITSQVLIGSINEVEAFRTVCSHHRIIIVSSTRLRLESGDAEHDRFTAVASCVDPRPLARRVLCAIVRKTTAAAQRPLRPLNFLPFVPPSSSNPVRVINSDRFVAIKPPP